MNPETSQSSKPSSSNHIEDIDEYSRQVLGALMNTIKASSSLPHSGDDFDLYNSFPGFRAFYNKQGARAEEYINEFLRHQGLKCLPQTVDVDDKYDRIVETNDTMLEQISVLLEDATAPKKEKSDVVPNVVQKVPDANSRPKTIVSSWNRERKHGKTQMFRLFHAQNIVRPQTSFKDKIDNSNVPFVPKITDKPNAIKPLPKALIHLHKEQSDSDVPLAIANLVRQGRQYNAEDQNIYGHPYESELHALKFSDQQLERVVPQKYDPFPSEPQELVTTKQELLSAIEHLKTCPEIAIDLEHHSYRSFQGITCLMQISSRTNDFLIDTLKLRSETHLFNELFTDPKIVKVFHGAEFDIQWLQRDFGVYVVNMFDTGQAAREMGLFRFSLDYLLQKYCDVHADKKYQLADWRIRPIPTEMRKYAQEDTHYLLYVYDVMKNELLDLGISEPAQGTGNTRLLNVLYRSREVCLRTYEKSLLSPNSHLQLYERRRSTKQLNEKQLELLRLLYVWRDTMARQEDESSGYVLPKHMLFQIAEIMPREAQGVLACCNPVPPLVRQHVHVIHQLVLEARAKGFGKKSDPANIITPSDTPVPAKPEVDNYEDILTCPHDLSHFDHPKTSKSKSTVSPKVPATNNSAFLNNSIAISEHNSHASKEVLSDTYWDPFVKFFPSNLYDGKKQKAKPVIASPEDLTLLKMLSTDYLWKLKNLGGEKNDKTDVKEVAKPQKTEEEDVIILSRMPQHPGQKRHPQPVPDKKMSRHAKKKAKKLANSDFQQFQYNKEHYDRFHYHKK